MNNPNNRPTQVTSNKDYQRQWDNLLTTVTQRSTQKLKGTKEQRFFESQQSIWRFAHHYLPHYCTQQPASFHAIWESIAKIKNQVVLVEAFRGAGKSTFFTFLDILHAILFARAHYILIGGYTEDRAQMFSMRILAELKANTALIADFGELLNSQTDRQAVGYFQTSAKDYHCSVQTISIGQNPRGLVSGSHRPDYVRLDDIQSRDAARNPANSRKAVDWIHYDLIPALQWPYSLIISATQVCPRDAVEQLRQPSDDSQAATSYRFPLTNKQGQSNWLSAFDQNKIIQLQRNLGRIVYRQEYLLDATRQDDGRIQADWLINYEPDTINIHNYRLIVSASDLGGGRSTGDYKATICIGLQTDGSIDVLAARIRHETPLQLIEGMYQIYEKYKPQVMLWEDNGQQSIMLELFKLQAQERRQQLPLKAITNKQKKESRIEGTLFPLLENNLVRFHPKNSDQRLLKDELLDFPQGNHDDGIDALEMAVRYARQRYQQQDSGNGIISLFRRKAQTLTQHYGDHI